MDNAEAIGKDSKFIGVTEMVIDILLFCVRAGSGQGEHEGIGHLVRGNVRIIFIKSFQLFLRVLRFLGLFSVTNSSIQEVSKNS